MNQTLNIAASMKAANQRRRNARIGFIYGMEQPKPIHQSDNPSGRFPVYLGNNDVDKLLDKIGETYRLDWSRVPITPGYFRQKRRWSFNDLDAAYVGISDPDQNPKAIKIAQRMLADARIPVINHPQHIQRSTRSNVAAAFADVPGVLMPKTVRIEKPRADLALRRIEQEAMRFPIIARPVGSHTGKSITLCRDATALAAAFGDAEGAHYLTEFVEFRSADGLYRKYRFFRIGREIVLRHVIASDDWFIHAGTISRFMIHSPKLIAEERSTIEAGIDSRFPGASELIFRLTEATGLDYVGIDCSFLEDGRILVFEINATMNFFPLRPESVFAYKKACVATATTALRELLEARIGRPVVPR